jgi:hypothetical protein
MQQDGTITFEPIVQTSPLETWHIVVAVILFVSVICFVRWLARRRSEKSDVSLHLGGDR